MIATILSGEMYQTHMGRNCIRLEVEVENTKYSLFISELSYIEFAHHCHIPIIRRKDYLQIGLKYIKDKILPVDWFEWKGRQIPVLALRRLNK